MSLISKLVICPSGSSRQFVGFSTEVEESVIDIIWKRAMVFFPNLREQPLSDFIERREVRVGLRPYSESHYLFNVIREPDPACLIYDLCKINKVILDVSVPDGKPVIGPVPGLSNVLLATGHEGGGLSMVMFVTTLLKILKERVCIVASLRQRANEL